MLPAATLPAVHWIGTGWPAVNVPEVGPVRVKVGVGGGLNGDRLGEVGVVRLAARPEIAADVVRARRHAGGVPTVAAVAVGGGTGRT